MAKKCHVSQLVVLVCPGPWLGEASGHIATEMYMNVYSALRMILYQSILKTNTQIFVKFVVDIHSPHYVCGDPLTFALVSPSGKNVSITHRIRVLSANRQIV